MSIGNIADHDARFVRLRLAIERSVADPMKFFFRKAIRKERSY
jgi:hypothetical protein